MRFPFAVALILVGTQAGLAQDLLSASRDREVTFMSDNDVYMEVLEIEIGERLCQDRTFLGQLRIDAKQCREKVLQAFGPCTLQHFKQAPREDGREVTGRLDSEAFADLYLACLREQAATIQSPKP